MRERGCRGLGVERDVEVGEWFADDPLLCPLCWGGDRRRRSKSYQSLFPTRSGLGHFPGGGRGTCWPSALVKFASSDTATPPMVALFGFPEGQRGSSRSYAKKPEWLKNPCRLSPEEGFEFAIDGWSALYPPAIWDLNTTPASYRRRAGGKLLVSSLGTLALLAHDSADSEARDRHRSLYRSTGSLGISFHDPRGVRPAAPTFTPIRGDPLRCPKLSH